MVAGHAIRAQKMDKTFTHTFFIEGWSDRSPTLSPVSTPLAGTTARDLSRRRMAATM